MSSSPRRIVPAGRASRARPPSAAWWSCRTRTAPSRAKNEPCGTVEVQVVDGDEVAEALGDHRAQVLPRSAPARSVWPCCVTWLLRCVGHDDHGTHHLENSLSYCFAVLSSSRHEPKVFDEISSSGKISGLPTRLSSIFGHRLLRRPYRADVVDPGGQRGRDLGLVVVVHQSLGVGLVVGLVGHHHVVAPQGQALRRARRT